LVHSSLSACGNIQGGTRSVIDALRDWVKPATLAMPAHSYCYPEAGALALCFDPASSRSNVGAITDSFWRQPGVVRSLHPTHSLACEGPLARQLCDGHELCEMPCGHGTPYERLVDWDAGVLMFGVSLNAYTLFHTAEDAANVPYLYEPEVYHLQVRGLDGGTRDFPMHRQDMRVTRRFDEMGPWLEDLGLLKRQRCGRGELLWLPHAAAVHDAVTEALRNDPWFLVAPEARPISAYSTNV